MLSTILKLAINPKCLHKFNYVNSCKFIFLCLLNKIIASLLSYLAYQICYWLWILWPINQSTLCSNSLFPSQLFVFMYYFTPVFILKLPLSCHKVHCKITIPPNLYKISLILPALLDKKQQCLQNTEEFSLVIRSLIHDLPNTDVYLPLKVKKYKSYDPKLLFINPISKDD